ncbi:hypothetical protein DSO57_1003832 [Entomophthora muscae]|uniref:Uncharacterized protein n=1 Tax=Entomophthora muscae TaxID=34485 RepID=A0ACC2UTT9_9FUNG|nr:hypothetical protein DSO57_1003832 [Entomophthora muscae]
MSHTLKSSNLAISSNATSTIPSKPVHSVTFATTKPVSTASERLPETGESFQQSADTSLLSLGNLIPTSETSSSFLKESVVLPTDTPVPSSNSSSVASTSVISTTQTQPSNNTKIPTVQKSTRTLSTESTLQQESGSKINHQTRQTGRPSEALLATPSSISFSDEPTETETSTTESVVHNPSTDESSLYNLKQTTSGTTLVYVPTQAAVDSTLSPHSLGEAYNDSTYIDSPFLSTVSGSASIKPVKSSSSSGTEKDIEPTPTKPLTESAIESGSTHGSQASPLPTDSFSSSASTTLPSVNSKPLSASPRSNSMHPSDRSTEKDLSATSIDSTSIQHTASYSREKNLSYSSTGNPEVSSYPTSSTIVESSFTATTEGSTSDSNLDKTKSSFMSETTSLPPTLSGPRSSLTENPSDKLPTRTESKTSLPTSTTTSAVDSETNTPVSSPIITVGTHASVSTSFSSQLIIPTTLLFSSITLNSSQTPTTNLTQPTQNHSTELVPTSLPSSTLDQPSPTLDLPSFATQRPNPRRLPSQTSTPTNEEHTSTHVLVSTTSSFPTSLSTELTPRSSGFFSKARGSLLVSSTLMVSTRDLELSTSTQIIPTAAQNVSTSPEPNATHIPYVSPVESTTQSPEYVRVVKEVPQLTTKEPLATMTLDFASQTYNEYIPLKTSFAKWLPPVPTSQYILTYPTYLPTNVLLDGTQSSQPTYSMLGTNRPQYIMGASIPPPSQSTCRQMLILLAGIDYRTLIAGPDTPKWLIVGLPQDLSRILAAPATASFVVNWIAPHNPDSLHLDKSVVVGVSLPQDPEPCRLRSQLNQIMAKDPARLKSTLILKYADPKWGAPDPSKSHWSANIPPPLLAPQETKRPPASIYAGVPNPFAPVLLGSPNPTENSPINLTQSTLGWAWIGGLTFFSTLGYTLLSRLAR